MVHMRTAGPPAIARDRFISAMREVASSVAIVTTDGAAGRHGATVTAFASVSADPPTVLVCLRSASRIAQLAEANGCFCLNVLPSDATDIADRFAGRDDERLSDRFAGIDFCGMPGQPPLIDGATAFSCRLDRLFRSGSHSILTGIVTGAQCAAVDPLTYRDGAYHRVVPHRAKLAHA